MSADYSKVHRLLRLVMLMQNGEAGNAAALAERLGVTERTVYRDIKVLDSLNVPCEFDPDTQAYRIRRDFFLPPIQLATDEALALLTLCDQVGGSEQIALTRPAARAMEKIRGQLPDRVLRDLGDLDRHMDIRLPATGPDGDAIVDVHALVREAIISRRALRCRYDSLNADSDPNASFLLRPYALTFDQRAWYVIGHHDGRDDIRRLKLNRFGHIEPTDHPYAIPDDFSMDAYRGQAWRMIRGDGLVRRIVIDFTATVADTVSETNWHPTQQIDLHDDRSITFTCDVEGLDEIVWWILGYGPHARVREPKELADQVANLARQTVERYDTSS